MHKPDTKNAKGMVLDGVFSSEAIDSSGEVVKLKGLDISSMEDGQSVANYEHKNKDDGGFGRETVGRIIYVKKIFNAEDCEDQRQRYYFKKTGGQSYLYGMIRLLDAAGHTGAQALAAQVRDAITHDDQILVRYSVEGTTLEKENNIIKTSIGRKVALTIVPCNKTCYSGVLVDGAAPDGYEKYPQEVLKSLQDPSNRCIGGSVSYECNPIVQDSKSPLDRLVESLELLKSMTSGSYDAAPSTLTGGSALQTEDLHRVYKDHIVGAIRDFDKPFDRKKFKEYLKDKLDKADLPEVSDSFLDHFVDIADDYQLKKSVVDPTADFFRSAAYGLESALIDLRKSVREELEGYNISMPQVYLVQMKVGGDLCPAGRFMVYNGQITHLEDYHKLLEGILPEGPVTPNTESTIEALKRVPEFVVSEHELTQPVRDEGVKEATITPQQPPPRPAVFEYWRPGMAKPHVVEFSTDWAAIDGQKLETDELQLILENARNGLASITWRTNSPNGGEIAPEEFNKSEEGSGHNIHAAMAALRAAVAAGHVHPDVERTMTAHLFEDHMIPGIGNKFAGSEFLKQKKPGVYINIDGNDLKHVNNTHGHTAGDQAIKSIGGALKDAAAKVGTIKLHRVGGDEFQAFAPTAEEAHVFMRHARGHLDNIPPIAGVHKPSVSFGLGQDHETADKALYHAKDQKVDVLSGKNKYLPSNTPNFAHSLLPGSEGPINLGSGQEEQVPRASKAA
jgi:GGDEF domain-containing protein